MSKFLELRSVAHNIHQIQCSFSWAKMSGIVIYIPHSHLNITGVLALQLELKCW